ncbi:MAG: ABC transporter ATP-binding protein [Acidobacteria bacterium]|nr:ABC transporter ATP-binding protein [Acidobacteriota bacterium]
MATETAAAVEVRALSRRFGDRAALTDVSFTVAKGESVALLGPNGGGKTTLFRILTTLLPPSSGDALVFGHSVTGDPHGVRRRLGVVFQKASLDVKLTVMENLIHHGHLHGLSGAPLRTRAAEMLARFGLADRARDRVETLSGGLARRVELAKGLLHRPEIVILDEPNTGLDPSARREFLDLLDDLRKRDGVTTLLTTHFLEEADRAERVAILDRGRLVAMGAPRDLRSKIGGDVVTLATDAADKLRALMRERFKVDAEIVHGEVRFEAPRGHEMVAAAVNAFPSEIRSAAFGRPTLEDVFVHLTGHLLSEDS